MRMPPDVEPVQSVPSLVSVIETTALRCARHLSVHMPAIPASLAPPPGFHARIVPSAWPLHRVPPSTCMQVAAGQFTSGALNVRYGSVSFSPFGTGMVHGAPVLVQFSPRRHSRGRPLPPAARTVSPAAATTSNRSASAWRSGAGLKSRGNGPLSPPPDRDPMLRVDSARPRSTSSCGGHAFGRGVVSAGGVSAGGSDMHRFSSCFRALSGL
mmetsp:Transcript_7717/g.31374  ORF Transcript_7717/g.31374 Transcript_7717/m.31374 type:complete len:212 (-) Transcript_7717:423-1058(-)